MGIKLTFTVLYDLAAFVPWWPWELCWKITNNRKIQNSSVTLQWKLNANLSSLSRLPRGSAPILTDSCRKWKPGDFLSLFVWTEEEKRKKEWKHDHFLWRCSQNAPFLTNARACAQSRAWVQSISKGWAGEQWNIYVYWDSWNQEELVDVAGSEQGVNHVPWETGCKYRNGD